SLPHVWQPTVHTSGREPQRNDEGEGKGQRLTGAGPPRREVGVRNRGPARRPPPPPDRALTAGAATSPKRLRRSATLVQPLTVKHWTLGVHAARPRAQSSTSSSGHWAILRCSVRRLMPINWAAFVRLPRALIKASRNKCFSFSSTESDPPAAVAGTPVTAPPPPPPWPGAGNAAGAVACRKRGSMSYSLSLPPRCSTTAFSAKL